MPAPSTRHIEPYLFITPAPPVNQVAPTLTPAGPYSTGQTVTCPPGTWTGNPAFTRQWKHDLGSGFVNIAGQTGGSYILQVGDEGHPVKCTVTGTNGGGSASVDSNAITSGVTAPLAQGDVVYRLSGGGSNAIPANSHGGAESSVAAGTDVWPAVPYQAARDGQIDYILVYVHNDNPAFSGAVVAYITLQEAHVGHGVAIGVATEAVDVTVAATASRFVAPVGVTFLTPANSAAGINLGVLGPGQKRGLWMRRTILAATGPTSSNPGVVSVEVTEQ